ncbi:MAG: hypothetical protein IFNCLDLE_01663 [Ignavibacteriaceae bacterium]|nr:hypothetical protein [Ignavibacteriaceae bacterium]MBW7874316.1 hypothetical protein [Ignavibacteria bacterium]MBZ0196120.1 hypothetical protein [Ignavibacteriaceae bacterium]
MGLMVFSGVMVGFCSIFGAFLFLPHQRGVQINAEYAEAFEVIRWIT